MTGSKCIAEEVKKTRLRPHLGDARLFPNSSGISSHVVKPSSLRHKRLLI
jgi:hypothetical protein